MNLDYLFEPFSPPETNFVERLRYWADAQPDQLAFRYLIDGEDEVVQWTYEQLDEKARAIAVKLMTMGMRGQRALLLYPPGLEFIAAFFGCHYAGVTPVPAYPPRRNRNVGRIQAISEDCDAKIALSVRDVISRVDGMLDDSPTLKKILWLATDEVREELAGDWVPLDLHDSDLGLLQYTSGSTGSPKGVMLTHGALMANCNLITRAFECGRGRSATFWLPAYHDMGLVGGILNPIFCGLGSTLMSPVHFLAKPIRWLRTISKYRSTISGGPNFAYALCAEKIDEADCKDLDLSCWELAFNGAEPVRAQVLLDFSKRFAKYGFRHRSHYPCYGMAETTLIVTGGVKDEEPIIRYFNGRELDNHKLIPTQPTDPEARALVGCGQVIDGESLAIVNSETCTLAKPGEVGEIWVQSPSLGQGYWNKPEVTDATFHAKLVDAPEKGNFLRTGDLGFFDRGELFVTGRLKDLIIIRGVNRYPQDIEATVEQSSPRLRNSCSGAFSVDLGGQERLVVVCEVERGQNSDWSDVFEAIRKNVSAEHEVPPDAIILVRSGSVPKTSSGKIQRHACRQAFLEDKLLVVSKWLLWEQQKAGESAAAASTNDSTSSEDLDPAIVEIVMNHVRAIAKERAKALSVATNIVIDLGLDSLERLQIANSLEQAFGGRFPDDVLQEIETIGEVASAVKLHIGDRPVKVGDGLQFSAPVEKPKASREIPEAYYCFEKMPEYLRLQQMRQVIHSTGIRDPFFSVHEGLIADTTMIGDRELISFASYNYLGLSGHPEVSTGAKAAIDRYGTSVSASRLVSGEKRLHRELEEELASFFGFEDVITFPGGHATNETVIGHLFSAGDLIIHDSLAHNSIIQGAMLSGARRRAFEHNNWQQLDEVLSEIRHDYRRVLIAIEGLYSMDGDSPDLPKFIEVKKKHKAVMFVDEAHSMGTLGETGRGIAELYGIHRKDVELWMGTLSKSFGSCGGFIGASKELIHYLRYTTPGFVFANGIPPAQTGAALASVKMLRKEPERVLKLKLNSELFLKMAKEYGLNTGFSHGSPVIPVITGNSLAALKLSELLYDAGINAQPILHPAVEEDRARVRFFLTAAHSEEQIRHSVQVVAEKAHSIDPRFAPGFKPVLAR